MTGRTRGAVQRLIVDGHVLKDDKPVKASLRVHAGDAFTVADAAEAKDAARGPLARIVYEDADIIVVDKPSGLLVHETEKHERDTLAAQLAAHFPAIKDVGDSAERPGIVHRLDREASGLMVVAKTAAAFNGLKTQFKNRVTKKIYLVLTSGAPSKDAGEIRLSIGRSARGGRMASHTEAMPGDRAAVTHYKVIERFPKAALLEVSTETGRTHQIRTHLHAIGTPVAGDTLYNPQLHAISPRLFLHASSLSFTHPTTGAPMTFSAPLPMELEAVVERLRRGAS